MIEYPKSDLKKDKYPVVQNFYGIRLGFFKRLYNKYYTINLLPTMVLCSLLLWMVLLSV